MLMMLSSGSTLEVELVFICSQCIPMCLYQNNSCNLSGLQRLTARVVRTLRVLCRLCTAECVPAMHDESHHVFVV
jgi:hypothetical protein